jgi:glutathione S-transferase
MMLWSAAAPAPNPRRVTIFLAEKGLTIPVTDLAIFAREHKAPAFLAKNPRGQVPALELDDGTVIAESISICRYLDALHPEPPLFGVDPLDRALVDMVLRRVETILGVPLAMVWMHTHPLTAAVVVPQYRDFGESNRAKVDAALAWFDGQLAGGGYVAGERFTIADIALWTSLDFARFAGIATPDNYPALAGWFARVAARPSITG